MEGETGAEVHRPKTSRRVIRISSDWILLNKIIDIRETATWMLRKLQQWQSYGRITNVIGFNKKHPFFSTKLGFRIFVTLK